jgi:hypothetical protein
VGIAPNILLSVLIDSGAVGTTIGTDPGGVLLGGERAIRIVILVYTGLRGSNCLISARGIVGGTAIFNTGFAMEGAIRSIPAPGTHIPPDDRIVRAVIGRIVRICIHGYGLGVINRWGLIIEPTMSGAIIKAGSSWCDTDSPIIC